MEGLRLHNRREREEEREREQKAVTSLRENRHEWRGCGGRDYTGEMGGIIQVKLAHRVERMACRERDHTGARDPSRRETGPAPGFCGGGRECAVFGSSSKCGIGH